MAWTMRGPETRESRPTATRSPWALRPKWRLRHIKNEARMASTAASVRVTGWPSTPSTATPRMSVPLFSCV